MYERLYVEKFDLLVKVLGDLQDVGILKRLVQEDRRKQADHDWGFGL